jgi:hypothetical protein
MRFLELKPIVEGNIMSHYIRIVLNLIFIGASIGLVVPFLFSAADDLLVAGGFAYLLFVMPSVLYYFNRDYAKKIMEKFNEV